MTSCWLLLVHILPARLQDLADGVHMSETLCLLLEVTVSHMQNGENCCTESEVAAFEAAFLADRQTVQTVPHARKRRWQRWTASKPEGSAAIAVEQPSEDAEYAADTASRAAQGELTRTTATALDRVAVRQEASDATRRVTPTDNELTAGSTRGREEAGHWPRRLTSWSVRT